MTAPPANLNALWARALVAELVRGGVREAVVCPGSRSTPLALACADAAGLRVHSFLDERSGAFFALGAAKGTGAPALVLATSGTAGAHFYPALLEAEASGVPVIALTADRPPELQGWGAPQTLDQRALFGAHVRFFADLGLPEANDVALRHLRATAARAAARALQGPRGPVHLNVPFREPLAPVSQPTPPELWSHAAPGGPPLIAHDGAAATASGAVWGRLAAALRERPRGVVVCGPRDAEDGLGPAAAELAATLGYALLAEAASQVRFGAPAGAAIAHADAIVRAPGWGEALRPQAVVRLGGGLTSKALQAWLDASGALTVAFSDGGLVVDPAHTASHVVLGTAPASCRALTAAVRALGPLPAAASPSAASPATASPAAANPATRPSVGASLAEAFGAAEARVSAALRAALEAGGLGEPRTAAEVVFGAPPGGLLFVSSSMPIRDVDAFASRAPEGLRVLASRGVNGIDGVISTALGAGLATGRATVVLIGDLALQHDLGGLLAARTLGLSCTVVVVNNDGGGIFSFLPLAGTTPHFEPLFATPQGLDCAHVAALAGARLHRPVEAEALQRALREARGGGLHLIEVRTDRTSNVAEHKALLEAAHLALGPVP